MPNDVVRFPQGGRHGWYLGRDTAIGLLPGKEREWPALWARYTRETGHTLADLTFADEEQREEFRRDVGLPAAQEPALPSRRP